MRAMTPRSNYGLSPLCPHAHFPFCTALILLSPAQARFLALSPSLPESRHTSTYASAARLHASTPLPRSCCCLAFNSCHIFHGGGCSSLWPLNGECGSLTTITTRMYSRVRTSLSRPRTLISAPTVTSRLSQHHRLDRAFRPPCGSYPLSFQR